MLADPTSRANLLTAIPMASQLTNIGLYSYVRRSGQLYPVQCQHDCRDADHSFSHGAVCCVLPAAKAR
jgi:hypothetical protein